ncbi:MAG: hypothetical protein WC969_08290 [Elusimicrobiota bacterium]|jgi:hypothetical protein
MLKSLWQYFKIDVWRHIRSIIFSVEILVSILGGIGVRCASHLGLLDLAKLDAMISALLTYATISFGFCVAAISIVINIPNPRFARKLANSKLKAKKADLNAYSDLLFIFSWTAMWHWLLIVLVLIVQLWKPAAWKGWHFLVLGFITIYALCLFLIMLLAITQFGSAYIQDIRDNETS